MILGPARQIGDPFVTARIVGAARMASHDVGIDISRINRVADRDPVPLAEDIENVATIGLRSFRNKYFVRGDFDPAIAVILLRDLFPERFEPLFVAVTAESFT